MKLSDLADEALKMVEQGRVNEMKNQRLPRLGSPSVVSLNSTWTDSSQV